MTTPDPTAVAAVAAAIEQNDYKIGERLARRLAPLAVTAYDRHLAAQATVEDQALVKALRSAAHQQGWMADNLSRDSVLLDELKQKTGDAETALLARLAQRSAPAIDRAGWSKAVTRLEQAARNTSWRSWDYEADRRADQEKKDARKALDALVAPFLTPEGK